MIIIAVILLLVLVTVIALTIALTSVRLPVPSKERTSEIMASWIVVWLLVLAATWITFQFVRWLV